MPLLQNLFLKSVLLSASLLPLAALAQKPALPTVRQNVPLDSIRLSDPFIVADQRTHTYYMTGTGGLLWQSKDLKSWTGPTQVAQPDTTSWMGPNPQIWAHPGGSIGLGPLGGAGPAFQVFALPE